MGLSVTLESRLPAVRAALRREMGVVVAKTAGDAERVAKESMTGPKHGRVYARRLPGGGVVFHQASAPGEAPAIDFGTLANSIEAVPEGPLAWAVVVGAEHGLYLETGTRHMAPRPFMGPAIKAVTPAFVAATAAALARAAAVGEVRGA